MADSKKPAAPAPEAVILPPDYNLKKKIGEDIDIREILSSENIRRSQEYIRNSQEEYLGWVMKDLVTMEHAYRSAIRDIDHCEPHAKKILRTAFAIKSQAGTYGYDLASEVAKSLYYFCEHHFQPQDTHLLYIRKHIEALTVIFQRNITGTGGLMGRELMHNLSLLGQRYIHQD